MVSWRRLYCLWYVRRACNFFAAFAAFLFISSAIMRVFKDVLLSPKHQAGFSDSDESNRADYRSKVHMKNVLNKVYDKGANSKQKVICVRKFGRFGNQMFQVAALLGVASRNNMKAFLETDSDLIGIFSLDDLDIQTTRNCDKLPVHHEIRPAAFDINSVEVDPNTDVAIAGYFQSWRYFDGISDLVRRQFTLRPLIYKEALSSFSISVQNQLKTPEILTQSTLVAVHVRRGDLTNPDRRHYGNNVASVSYLHNSMSYFRILFKPVIFVVSSDDMNWTRSHVAAPDVVYLEGIRADVDFAILSQCDHAIVTVGTFGWWVAWLVNGISVYYKHPYTLNSYLYNNTNLADFIPPSWVGME